MPTIAITGGVASGKTVFRQFLSSRWNAQFFDADATVHELINTSKEVTREIQEVFGSLVYREGELDRGLLRNLVFSKPELRKRLESILHPRVQAIWREHAENCSKSGNKFLVEIPLLYETGGEAFCDFVIVVASSFPMQLNRIVSDRGVEESLARKIIESQMPVEKKVSLADQVVWNDGPEGLLSEHAVLTANYLLERYG